MFQDWAWWTGPKLWTLPHSPVRVDLDDFDPWAVSRHNLRHHWLVWTRKQWMKTEGNNWIHYFFFFFSMAVLLQFVQNTREEREHRKKRITWKFNIFIFSLLYQKKKKKRSIWHLSVHIASLQCIKLIHQSFEIFIRCLWDFLNKTQKHYRK